MIGDRMPYWLRHRLSGLFRFLSPDFSSCLRCGMPWCAATERAVPYAGGDHPYGLTMSGFAICTSCWGELGTAERRLPFYLRLAEMWGPDHNGLDVTTLSERFATGVIKESSA